MRLGMPLNADTSLIATGWCRVWMEVVDAENECIDDDVEDEDRVCLSGHAFGVAAVGLLWERGLAHGRKAMSEHWDSCCWW
jgi:hypothetical protein